MNNLATEATAMVIPLPLETIWPVLRSSTTAEMSAPAFAASAVAWRARPSRPSNVAAGSSGGASGNGARLPCGATTVSCGPAGAGVVPYTFASQPATTSAAVMTADAAISLDGCRRMTLLKSSRTKQGARRSAQPVHQA